ncbi:ABC transporter permease [Paenibacillus oenotherae]|uniref:ABC transporter permease n=1 Tax=Paenibacillus oenotherae TaxID=1435645 RepID=A0ABS7D3G9_9BACL|nr:ABC transporter permease [Paenibacillus oenotherae]MBW7474435.1 ABC transporter permease [Paenibacillus oenotherae]
MRILLLQIILELRLLAKLRWPLLLPLPAFGWMLLEGSSSDSYASGDINLYAVDAHAMIMLFAMAVPILLGVLLIRRDTLSSIYEWSLSLPVPNGVIIASKWIAGFLYSSLFTVAAQAAYLILVWQHGLPWSSAMKPVLFFSMLYEMSFAAAVALGLILGALMPLRFSLPIAFCGWMFGSLFVPIFLASSFQWHPLKAFSFNHLISNSSLMTNEGWFYGLNSLEYKLLLPFVALFSLFMLTATAALVARVRPVRRPAMPAIIMLAALLLSGISYIPYGMLWKDRYGQLDAMRAAAPPQTAVMLPHEPYTFRIDSMKLDVMRHPDDRLEMTADILLPTDKDGRLIPSAPMIEEVKPHKEGFVSFLLDPLLKVHSFKLDGADIPWQQDGPFISFEQARLLDTAGDQHSIAIGYSGTINRWMPNYSSESYAAFAVGHNVFLPGHFGWFPLPGGSGLYSDNLNLLPRGDIIRYLRADFELTVSGFHGPIYSSLPAAPDDTPQRRHFARHAAEAPELIGGDFRTVRIEGEPVTIVTTAGNVEESRAFLQELKRKRSYYEAWLGEPLDAIRQIVYFPMNQLIWNSVNTGQSYANGNTIYISATKYQGFGFDQLQRVMGKLIFGDLVNMHQHVNNWEDYKDPNEDYSMIQEIRALILSLEHLDGLPREQLARDSIIYGWFALGEPLSNKIKEAYMEGNGELVKRVLKRFLDQGLYIEDFNEHGGLIVNYRGNQQYQYPAINWQNWLNVWNEEKGR